MPSSRPPSIPVGRVRRGVKVGALLGVETARGYATRIANVRARRRTGRPPKSAADSRQQTTLVEVLGQMKGAAMKVGQLAALMDFDRLPGDGRDEFQAKLAQLHDVRRRPPSRTCRR